MTQQEAFDRMVGHLAKQQRPCEEDGRCLYRGPNGMKCIIGSLIKTATAKTVDGPSYGDTSVGADDVWDLLKKQLALSDLKERSARAFYKHMQNAHDMAKNLPVLKKALKAQAMKYKLKHGKVNSIKEWVR